MLTVTHYLKRILGPQFYAYFYRHGLNFWPCIRRTGGKVIHLSADFKELKVQLKLSWQSRNLVGTIFGGSMYASTDPMFMLMLIEILGPDFVVWDKGCTIRFRRPAVKKMICDFKITEQMLTEVMTQVHEKHEHSFTWQVAYKDEQGLVYCELDKVLYIAKKAFYKEKLKARAK